MTGKTRNRTTRKSTKIHAVAYLRTSSATNVGGDKDSGKRQRAAIAAFAKANGYVIQDHDWFYDEAVSGADALGSRTGWNALMERILSNGVRTVLVEDASRFARDLMVQESGICELQKAGVTVVTADGEDLTASDDPGRTVIRQILGSFSQYEKARTVAKLRAARERMRAETGRCEGRKPLAETHPEAAVMAKKLRRAHPTTGERMSLRKIASRLATAGLVNSQGKPFAAAAVLLLLKG